MVGPSRRHRHGVFPRVDVAKGSKFIVSCTHHFGRPPDGVEIVRCRITGHSATQCYVALTGDIGQYLNHSQWPSCQFVWLPHDGVQLLPGLPCRGVVPSSVAAAAQGRRNCYCSMTNRTNCRRTRTCRPTDHDELVRAG